MSYRQQQSIFGRSRTVRNALLATLAASAFAWSTGVAAQTSSVGDPSAHSDADAAMSAQVATSTAPSLPNAPSVSSPQVEEIVVTAQRRSQNLQEVPISIAAFNAATLTSAGITNVGAIAQVDPSINIGSNNSVVTPFLRGVGNPGGTTIGNESSVPIYIDDVYYTRLSSAYLELANIDRVEVLKGPQGTLFGRNASAGAIQVFTRDPGRTDALELTGGYANYDTVTGKLYVSKPLGDDVGINLSVSARHQGNGWGQNLNTGDKTYQYNFLNIRSKLVARPTDKTTVHVEGFYVKSFSERVVSGRYLGTLGSTAPYYGPSQIVPPAPGFYDTVSTLNDFYRTRAYGASVKVDQDLSFAQITSVTAYRHASETGLTDGENNPENYSLYSLPTTDKQFSEELQLKSRVSSKVNWIAGVYYLNARQGYTPATVTGDSVTELSNLALGLPAAPGVREELFGQQRIRSLAGFGQVTVPVTDTTNVTLGGRYTRDHIRGIGSITFIDPGIATIPFSQYDRGFTFKKFTYRAAIDQKIADHIRVYGSVSRGYKSGTFNTLPLNSDPTKPETVDAYEVGIKSELFDRRLRLNAAAFQNDIKDPQVQTVIVDPATGSNFVALTNAQKARSRGFEVNADAVIATGLSATLGATYLNAKYLRFDNAPFYYPIVNGSCPNGGSSGGYIAGLCSAVAGNASGHRLVQVPKWRLAGGLNYTTDTAAGKVSGDVNAAYTTKFYWDPDSIISQRPYALVNASIAFTPAAYPSVTIRGFVDNLTFKRYYAFELPSSGGGGNLDAPGAPRTYGIEIGIKL